MRSPFWGNVRETIVRLEGRSLTMVVLIWLLLLALGIFCAFGGLALPAAEENESTGVPTTRSEETGPTINPQSGGVGGGGEETATPVKPTVTLPAEAVDIPTPTPLPEDAAPDEEVELPPLPWGDFGYGIAVQGVIPVAGDYTYSMRQVRDHLGLGWVKQQLRWDDVQPNSETFDWSKYDPVVAAADEMGLKLLLSVVKGPKWTNDYASNDPDPNVSAPPADLTLYTEFLGKLVERYKGRVHAIEVWNEQNLAREWDNAEGINAERYTEMLRLAYQTIKSRDPNIIVISGALSPTGANFTDPDNPNRITVMDDYVYLQQMIDAGALDYADCIGAHANGINMPPDVAWDEGYNDPTASFRGPFDNPHHSWSFKSTIWGYYNMAQKAGYEKPICLTEFGWASAEGWSEVAPGFEFAWDNTLEEQAEWDVQGFQLMRRWGIVHLAMLWNLDYWQKGGMGMTDPNAPYSILDAAGAPRPAYDAIGQMKKIP
ncbi:MAG: hypothetical protein ACP5HM_10595 [Anaerolineae bacterium]